VIIRVGTGHVPERYVGVVNEVIRERLREVLTQDGLIACHLGRQFDAAGQKLLLVTVWRDMPALYRWVEGDLNRRVILHGLDAQLDRFEIQLYESLVDLPELTPGAFSESETSVAGERLTS
jgi:heme-degrading monooxygenase HmoA